MCKFSTGRMLVAAALVFSALVLVGCGGDDGNDDNPSSVTYKVTFNANGGSGTVPTAKTVDAGSSITLPNQGSLTNSGYDFDGWNTKDDGTGTNYSAGSSYTPTGNVTLYAKWVLQSEPVPFTPTFTDSRDNKTYKRVKIGNQIWMAENLNYDVTGSKCLDDDPANCAAYGKLYDWPAAKAVCPSGWHLPSDAEWTQLTTYVGGELTAGTKLKSSTGWFNNGNGTDDFGFSALPGSYGSSDGSFASNVHNGYWWSATDVNASNAWCRDIYESRSDVRRYDDNKTYLLSVRCVAD